MIALPLRRRYRLQRLLGAAASATLGVVLLIWSLMPCYNMLLMALDPEGDTEFSGYVWPPEPSLESFRMVWTQGYWYLEDFWNQFGNSLYVGLLTMLLTVLIGSLASLPLAARGTVKAVCSSTPLSSRTYCHRRFWPYHSFASPSVTGFPTVSGR